MVGKKSFLPTIRPGRRSKRTYLPGFSENPTESCEKKHRKIPPRKRSQTFLFGFAIVIIVLHFIIESFGKTSVPSDGNALVERSIINNEDKTSSTFVSVVILTYKNPELLSNLLSSVISQKPDKFEVIIVDAGCLDETQDVIIKHFPENSETEKRLKYLPQCHNPGYAISNNEAVKMAARSSKWILLLNDDLELQGNLFIDEMLKLGNSKPNLSIVGCKMLNGSGDEIDEAGSIVWKDASAAGFGRGRKDINASEFMYPRPVDYVSGACIMVKKRIFDDYGGFDSEKFPNYYEDTDLQMHVQHELEKEVWLQPRAIALHNAHASFGSEAGTKLMAEHSKIFKKKWDFYLRDKHLAAPFHLSQQQQEVTFLKANDLRARDPSIANILYIDLDIPTNIKSQQINRSYQNLSLLSRLGHRITVVSYHETTDEKCDLQCRDDIQKYGIEVAMGSWYELAEKRAGFYDIVVISQPSTFLLTYKELATLYQKAPFVLIYDFDTFQYLAYESIIKLQKNGYTLPSISYESVHQPEHEIMLTKQSEIEHKLIATADFVVTSSPKDIEKVSTVYPNTLIHSISHVQNKKQQKFPSFDDRSGILFLLSFGVNTDYNFDAIFFFLENIYMNVLKEAHSSIPLTIAGQFIPENLRVLVENTTEFNDTVTFIQTSEEYYTTLYDTARLVILPHPYGNGLDYQVSLKCLLRMRRITFHIFTHRNQLFDRSNLSYKSLLTHFHTGSQQLCHELVQSLLEFQLTAKLVV